MKRAFITGVTGQDGSYLAEFLLGKGYEVHGLVRRTSMFNRDRLSHIYKSLTERNKNFFLHYGDMTDSSSLTKILAIIRPDEIYNLAAQSHVHISFDIPEYTASTDAIGVLRLLECVRMLGLKDTKIYQASTSELFGKAAEVPQKETTPFHPRSPYAAAKLYAYWVIKNYRDAYGMFACNGILFNHESPRRGENFVSKKITQDVAAIKLGLKKNLLLGNLNAVRDWGYAPDYVEAMWLMLQQEKPEDFVIATCESHSVREFVEESFKHIGINIIWEGEGLEEKGIDNETGEVLVEIDSRYFRPAEVDFLMGDYTKAKNNLHWEPRVRFEELVKIMVDADIESLNNHSLQQRCPQCSSILIGKEKFCPECGIPTKKQNIPNYLMLRDL
ncbi:MAG: GDP-mannose 4,6-dehydratase [Nanoarchaeota archaeon]|nr:GDP-mannose 4,6-dehydratase [Nanoarchaeota archaeon]